MSVCMRTLALPVAASTENLGSALSRVVPGDRSFVVHLRGELGAGKTSLARALLRGLGWTGSIKSPTYSLVERYPLPDGREAVHLDLYRIREPAELEFLGLDDLAGRAVLWLVEWPERGGTALPPVDLEISLEHAPSGRRATLRTVSPAAQALWPNLNKIEVADDSA
jgi:tRNA threonylcarbamoyladenosine biosynthesis protein TsaE